MAVARPFALLLLLAGLVLPSGYAAASLRLGDHPPLYTVASLRAHLDHHPQIWVGQTVLVRATLAGCPYVRPGPCASWRPLLVDRLVEAGGLSALPVQLHGARTGCLETALRRLPLVSALLPAPRALGWEARGIYRVQLRTAPAASCGHAPCYEALLLGAGS